MSGASFPQSTGPQTRSTNNPFANDPFFSDLPTPSLHQTSYAEFVSKANTLFDDFSKRMQNKNDDFDSRHKEFMKGFNTQRKAHDDFHKEVKKKFEKIDTPPSPPKKSISPSEKHALNHVGNVMIPFALSGLFSLATLITAIVLTAIFGAMGAFAFIAFAIAAGCFIGFGAKLAHTTSEIADKVIPDRE